MVSRRIVRWGLVQHVELRRWISEQSGVPGAGVSARLSVPAAVYYARAVGADEPAVRRALEGLPGMLDRVDALLSDGVLVPAAPTAATLQVLCSVRALGASPTSASRSPPAPPPRPHASSSRLPRGAGVPAARVAYFLVERCPLNESTCWIPLGRFVNLIFVVRMPGANLIRSARSHPTSTPPGLAALCGRDLVARRHRSPPTASRDTCSCRPRRRTSS